MSKDSSKIREILKTARLIYPFGFTLLGLLTIFVTAIFHIHQMGSFSSELGLLLIAVSMTLVGVVTSAMLLKDQLLRPLSRLQESVSQVCQGEPGARVLNEDLGVLEHLSHDIDSVYEELSDLYEDMDNRVERQTRRLAQKTASLKILYDVAASINQSETLDDLLLRFLRILFPLLKHSPCWVLRTWRPRQFRKALLLCPCLPTSCLSSPEAQGTDPSP